MDYAEAKAKIVEELERKSKSKSKFYFNDLSKILELKPREAKKLVNQMVSEGILEYWSSHQVHCVDLFGSADEFFLSGIA